MAPELPTLEGVRHRFVDLPGLRMHVAEAGEGEPVLLLHGFPQDWWEWRGVIPLLAPHYRVIAPDLRGCGRTEAPRDGYDREHQVGDVLNLIDALGLDRVRLVGHDWGALVGFALCLERPERVRSYVSLAIPHPWVRPDPRLLSVAWRLWFQLVIATPGLGPWALRQGRLPRHLLRVYRERPDAMSQRDVEHFVGALRDPARARAGSALYRRLILTEAGRMMAGRYRSVHLDTPTLLLCGSADPAIRPELFTGHQEYVDRLEVAVVPGGSHFLAEDCPEAVAERILCWP